MVLAARDPGHDDMHQGITSLERRYSHYSAYLRPDLSRTSPDDGYGRRALLLARTYSGAGEATRTKQVRVRARLPLSSSKGG